MAEVYPDVPLADSVSGNDTLLDIAHAREVLGYDPQFSWRDLTMRPSGRRSDGARPARARVGGLGSYALSGTAASGVATWKLKLCSRYRRTSSAS